MKRVTIVFVGMAVALLGNVTFAQEASGIPDEIIKELDSLAGTWVVEGKVGEQIQTGGFTCRWMRNREDKRKVCLMGQFSYETGGSARSGVTLIGWNAAKNCIEDRGFDANGGCAVLYWTVKSPKEYQGEVIMVQNGREVRSKAVLVKKGPSEIVIESESEAGELSRFVFRKVEPDRKPEARK